MDPVQPDPGPLSAEQKAELAEARERLRVLLRPARLASASAWTVGVFGGLTLLWGLVAGPSGIVVGLLLVGVAVVEFRGRNLLRSLDPAGPRLLARNQLLLAIVVVGYCVFAVVRARTAPDPSVQELEELAGLSPGLVAELTALVYGIVALVVLAVQVWLARYHARREAMVEAFRRDTPPWVVELLVADRGAS